MITTFRSRVIDPIRNSISRLTEREQFAVAGGAAAAVLIIFFTFGFFISRAIHKAETRVRTKSAQLTEILAMESVYRAKQQEHEEQVRELSRSKTRLVSIVEQVGREAGIEIGQLRPDDSEPNAEGIIESRVDLRAAGLSADRLQKFLSSIEKSKGAVLRRLRVNKPYKKDTVDIEVTVTSYKLKG
jgi:hypothetical protein